jgi:hypothetical protein
LKEKGVLLCGNEVVENSEIYFRPITFHASNSIKWLRLPKIIDQMSESAHGCVDGWHIWRIRIVPCGAHENRPAVRCLSHDHHSGNIGGSAQIVRSAILFSAQQDVARDWPLNSRVKFSPLAQKRDGNISLPAQSHQGRTTRDPSEADNSSQGVNRYAEFGLFLNADQDGLAVAGKI